jgi:hypothetical protein
MTAIRHEGFAGSSSSSRIVDDAMDDEFLVP